ncbi:hypothetical protein OT109_01215 [Phycisphaeraceae bacterium D3-23]
MFLLLALGLCAFIGAVLWFMVKTLSAPPTEQPDFTPDGEHRNPRPRNIPACGKCGYPARGLNTFECPECGADLREVGIVTPGMRRGGAGCVLPIVWTVGIFFGGAILGNALSGVLPRAEIGQYHVQLTPKASTYQMIVLSADYSGPRTGQAYFGSSYSSGGSNTHLDLSQQPYNMQLEHLNLRLYAVGGPAPGPRDFEVDYAGQSFRYQNGNGQWVSHTGTPQSKDVKDWFKSNQLRVGLPVVAQEADELSQLMDALAARQPSHTLSHFKASQNRNYTHLEPIPNTWRVAYILLCFIIWLLGLMFLNRRPKQTTNKI